MDPTEAQLTLLQNEHGISKDEFLALDERDRANLLADVPDDTVALPDGATPPATPEPTAAPVATPAPTTAPVATPQPTAAPVATPAPTAAPVATPQPTAAPVAPEVLAADPLGVGLVPDLIIPAPLVKAEDRTKLEANKTAIDELDDKFAEGNLTKEEYRAAKKPLEAENERIQGDIAAERATANMVRAEVNKHWDASVALALKQAKDAGLDFHDAANADKAAELDAAIKRFGQASGLVHPTKNVLWRDRWALAEATREVTAKYGFSLNIHTPAPGATLPAKTVHEQRAPADLSNVPPTLRGAPEAGAQNIQAGEFAHLEAMTLQDREKAVALMTPDQQERYLA
jgi:hypothetical protein